MSRFRFVTGTVTPVLFATVVGCGGSVPQASDGSSASASQEMTPSDPAAEQKNGNKEEAEEDGAGTKSPDGSAKEPSGSSSSVAAKSGGATADPDFPEGASVAQAIAAIPRDMPRANIDTDRLGESLQNASLFEPCKVGAQHFKLRVAVWNGHAVGVDVDSSNKALASCVDKQVRGMTFPDKVRSLNTIEFAM